MSDKSIAFPNMGIELENVGKSFSVFGFDIAFYGLIIGFGMMMGLLVAMREAKRTKQNQDMYLDFALYAFVFSIIGARLYYVIFSWDDYKNDLLSIFNLREGGLAIYGAVIAAVITLIVFAKIKKQNFWLMADTGCLGLITGQMIGRWGNFFNREVFGGYTDSLFAMRLPVSAIRSTEDLTAEMMEHMQDGYIQVHPTFLYESVWNLGVLVFLLFYRKHKHFDGELFFIYLGGYGFGRAIIEGVRTDQLLIPGTSLPVSQVLAIIMVLVAACAITFGNYKFYQNKKKTKDGEV